MARADPSDAPHRPPPRTGRDGSAPGGAREAALARESNPLKRFWKLLGPGFITGASDDDPSGIGTYAIAGASLGYATLWTALITFPLMAATQFISAKIGLVSGQGLAAVLRQHYPRWLLYPVVLALALANTINAGADIGAIAAAINLLVPIPIEALIVPVAVSILVLLIWGSYRLIDRTFKWLCLALLAYVGSALLANPDWRQVLLNTLIPTIRLDVQFIETLVAILGTTISPYLWFWQASQEVEEQQAVRKQAGLKRRGFWKRRGTSDTELGYAAWDTCIGMFFSNLVMYFIILATAATLHQAGKTDISSAAEAAEALRPLAGDAAAVLLAVGLIGAGFLAVPVLVGSSAYAIAEAFGWQEGLDESPSRAARFYGVIAIATVVGLEINYLGLNPINALFYTAVIYGFLAPPLLFVIMLIANNPRVMGDRVNGRWTNVLGWATTLVMMAAAVTLVATWVKG
ncbi:MAG TPA: divalent metal cation transporter [Chloroflexota bacterium]|jgi:NRAMP (natural resistance-associated macrophage protein)-like metal ion transporter